MNMFGRWLQKRKVKQHEDWEESVSDVLDGVKNNIELILKSNISSKDKLKLLMRYSVSPREVLYPNVRIIQSTGEEKGPTVEYGNQLVIHKQLDGTRRYSINPGMLWGRGLLHSELNEL